jgi:hypothetical protein
MFYALILYLKMVETLGVVTISNVKVAKLTIHAFIEPINIS